MLPEGNGGILEQGTKRQWIQERKTPRKPAGWAALRGPCRRASSDGERPSSQHGFAFIVISGPPNNNFLMKLRIRLFYKRFREIHEALAAQPTAGTDLPRIRDRE